MAQTNRLPESPIGRRAFLQEASLGFGTLALAYLLDQERGEALAAAAGAARSARTSGLGPGHFPARARSVIMLMQVGGPSQIDLFDPKPELRRRDGQAYTRQRRDAPAGQRNQEADGQPVPVPPPRPVRNGALGTDPRDRLGGGRRLPGPVDVQRQQQSPAGDALPARRQDLPGPAVGRLVDQLCPGHGEPEPAGLRRAARPRRLQQRRHDDVGERLAAGHLPGDRDPVARRGRSRPASRRRAARRHPAQQPRGAGAARTRNGGKLYPHESELDARIRNYELAARMQLSAEEVLEISRRDRGRRDGSTDSTTR